MYNVEVVFIYLNFTFVFFFFLNYSHCVVGVYECLLFIIIDLVKIRSMTRIVVICHPFGLLLTKKKKKTVHLVQTIFLHKPHDLCRF